VSILAAIWGLTFLVTAPPFEGMHARGEFVLISKVAWFEAVLRLPLVIGLLWAVGLWGSPPAGSSPKAWLSGYRSPMR
jgi:hypothetical protein